MYILQIGIFHFSNVLMKDFFNSRVETWFHRNSLSTAYNSSKFEFWLRTKEAVEKVEIKT